LFPAKRLGDHNRLWHSTQFNEEVIDTVKSFGIQPKRTSFRSLWQNGVAEHWVGNCRRDLLDHVIILNERHPKRLMNEYVRYYHEGNNILGKVNILTNPKTDQN
jgi:hypothetical protein